VTRLTRYQKLQNAATKLNRDRAKDPSAYILRRGKLVGFKPCERSYVFLAACHPPTGWRPEPLRVDGLNDISTESVLSLVEGRAALTYCACHPHITLDELISIEYVID